MPPVNSAPSSDVDNEATAELPVLDVAAYEASLDNAPTDTWVMPSGGVQTAMEATTEMPAVKLDVPTLAAPVPAYDTDHSGTHEMPAMPLAKGPKRKHGRAAKASNHSRGNAAARPEPAVPVGVTPASVPKTATAPAPTPTPIEPVTLAPPAVEIAPAPAADALPSPIIEELRTALAAAERRIEELHERARIADAERSVAVDRANAESTQLRDQLAAHLEALSSAKSRQGVAGADQSELEDAFFTRGDRITALEKELAAQATVLSAVRSQLEISEQRCEALGVDGDNLRVTIARRNAHIAMIEADMAARQHKEAALKSRLEEAEAAANPDVAGLRAEIKVREAQVGELKSELELMRARTGDRDGDLEAAEESIRNLESELRDKAGKLQEVSVTVEEWRAVIAESQKSIQERDGRIQRLEADLEKRGNAIVDSASMTNEEVALEGPARVLIRTDGNTDYVHVLGRRTRIGRGSDNELVLDTKHVSRYHAVLLAGPVHTSIEDLNSTNGVFVNGKRVTRQALKDGDRVAIGRTQYRYSVRD
jgi:peptidoglycan hydrolase CwlO-like protein